MEMIDGTKLTIIGNVVIGNIIIADNKETSPYQILDVQGIVLI